MGPLRRSDTPQNVRTLLCGGNLHAGCVVLLTTQVVVNLGADHRGWEWPAQYSGFLITSFTWSRNS